eukprot:jgi/Hompol1/4800/HPOL_003910-RA
MHRQIRCFRRNRLHDQLAQLAGFNKHSATSTAAATAAIQAALSRAHSQGSYDTHDQSSSPSSSHVLTEADIDRELATGERCLMVPAIQRKRSAVARVDVCELESNTPIEDVWMAEAIGPHGDVLLGVFD